MCWIECISGGSNVTQLWVWYMYDVLCCKIPSCRLLKSHRKRDTTNPIFKMIFILCLWLCLILYICISTHRMRWWINCMYFHFVLLELRDRFSTKVFNGQMHIFKMDRTIKSWGDGWVKAGPMQSMASVACNYNVFI